MKIAIIGPAFPLRGGIANLNEALAISLTGQGDEVCIFSFSLQYPSLFFPGKTQFEENGTAPAGYRIVSCINSVNPLSWRKTAQAIAAYHPDAVIVRFWIPFMGPALGTICRMLRKKKYKIIAITDNVIPHEPKPFDRILTGYFLHSCHAFITMSKQVMQDLDSFRVKGPKKMLYHPVYNIFGEKVSREIALNELKLSEKNNYLLFFGFIRKYKGLRLLLEAMTDPRLKALNIKLLVAGEFYEPDKEYLDYITRYQLEERVILHNHYIESDKVRFYFCSASLVVQPYLSATQSGVTQIAYHFLKPMLVTDVGGLSEMVSHKKNGYVVPVQAKAVADAVIDFFQNNRESAFIEACAEEKKRFTWDYFTAGLKSLITEIK